MLTGGAGPQPASALCLVWPGEAAAAGGPTVGADRLATARQLALAHGGRIDGACAQALGVHFPPGSAQAGPTERALHCGLALLALFDPVPAQARPCLGVHSGPLAAEPRPDEPPDSLLRVAADLAQAAPPGRLCLSLAAAALVRGQFDTDPPMPLHITGRDSPLPASLLRSTVLAADDEVPAPLVGRQGELVQLQAAFAQVCRAARAAALTLLAEPGLGKSRLLQAFAGWALAQPQALHVLQARATAQTEGQPFGLLGRLLRVFCQIDADSSADAARARFEAVLLPWFLHEDGADQAQGHVHVLGHLIGLAFADSRHVQGLLSAPQQIRPLALHACALWLRRLTAAGQVPVLLQIEDLHWADSESLDCLDQLLKVNHDTALLLVGTGRPVLAETRPAWACNAGVHARLDLGPLAPAASLQLAAALLRRLPLLPPGLLDRVVQASWGNPYCIEERVKLLIDQGAIQAGAAAWSVNPTRWRTARLPDTLAGVLAARMKLLPAAERRVLQRASVIGPVFLQDALLALGAGAAQAMRGLMQRELTLAAGGAGGAGAPGDFSFKHQLLQQLAYDALPQLTRRALHGKLARWLLTLTGLASGDAQGLAAHHFEQAGDADLAADQHTRAAEQAASRSATQAVRMHVARALALLDGLPDQPERQRLRWRLLRTRVAMFESGSPRDQHLVDLDALAVLADAWGDDARRADAWASRCHFCMLTADYAAMKTAARQGMACASRAGAEALRLGAMRMLGMALLYQRDADAALRLVSQCLPQARALGLLRIESACLNTLAMIAQLQDDPVARLRLHEQELPLERQLGNRRNEALVLANIGGAWQHLGEVVQSRHYSEEALRLARSLGHRLSECGTLCCLSRLACWLGDGPEAVRLAQQAWEAAAAVGMPNWESLALQRLGEAHWAAGQPAASAAAFEREVVLALTHKLPAMADSSAGLARAALALGDLPAALQRVQELLDRDARSGYAKDADTPRRVELVCHLVLSAAGDSRAAAWLQRAHAELLATAANISDATLREGFLNNVPDHRAILSAWALQQQAAAPG